jgi:hypothetical protein
MGPSRLTGTRMLLLLLLVLSAPSPAVQRRETDIYDLVPGTPVHTGLNSSLASGASCEFLFRTPVPPRDVRAVRISVTADMSITVPYEDPYDATRSTHYDELYVVTAGLENPNTGLPDHGASGSASAFRATGSREARHVIVAPPEELYPPGSGEAIAWWNRSPIMVNVSNCAMVWPASRPHGTPPSVHQIAGMITIETVFYTGSQLAPRRNAEITLTPVLTKTEDAKFYRYAGYCMQYVLPQPCTNMNMSMYFRELHTSGAEFSDPQMTTTAQVRNSSVVSPIPWGSEIATAAAYNELKRICQLSITNGTVPHSYTCVHVDLSREALRPMGLTLEFINNATGESTVYGVATGRPDGFMSTFPREVIEGAIPSTGTGGVPVPGRPLPSASSEVKPLISNTEFPKFAVVLLVFTFFFAVLFVVFACLRGRAGNRPGDDPRNAAWSDLLDRCPIFFSFFFFFFFFSFGFSISFFFVSKNNKLIQSSITPFLSPPHPTQVPRCRGAAPCAVDCTRRACCSVFNC